MRGRIVHVGSRRIRGVSRRTHPRFAASVTRCRALLFLLCCIALPVLAYASPPDPVWIPGVYDFADYDDVVGLLGDSAALQEPAPATIEPIRFTCRPLPSVGDPVLPGVPPPASCSRAPPTF